MYLQFGKKRFFLAYSLFSTADAQLLHVYGIPFIITVYLKADRVNFRPLCDKFWKIWLGNNSSAQLSAHYVTIMLK